MSTTLEKIKELKVHPRQSSEDVITNLIKFYKDNCDSCTNDIYNLKQKEGE